MSSSKNLEIAKTSFLNKNNSAFIDEMYLRYIEKDPSLPLSWQSYFKSLGDELSLVAKEIEGPTWKPNKKKINVKDSSKENIEKILHIEDSEVNKNKSINQSH